jgi:hypothetical protein
MRKHQPKIAFSCVVNFTNKDIFIIDDFCGLAAFLGKKIISNFQSDQMKRGCLKIKF